MAACIVPNIMDMVFSAFSTLWNHCDSFMSGALTVLVIAYTVDVYVRIIQTAAQLLAVLSSKCTMA